MEPSQELMKRLRARKAEARRDEAELFRALSVHFGVTYKYMRQWAKALRAGIAPTPEEKQRNG